MAKWSDRLNQMTQSAISKSKEVAGIAKLNVDNSALNLDIKNIQTQIGAYVLKNKLLQDDASIRKWTAKAEEINSKIEKNNEKIRKIKNLNVCPECGAEVSGDGRFCEKCGAELIVPDSAEEASGTGAAEEEAAEAVAEEVDRDVAAVAEEVDYDVAAVAEEVDRDVAAVAEEVDRDVAVVAEEVDRDVAAVAEEVDRDVAAVAEEVDRDVAAAAEEAEI